MSVTLLRLPAVCERTGIGRSAIYARAKDGRFPKPVPIGPRLVGWPEHEVSSWIDATIRGSSDEELRQLVTLLHQQRGYKPNPQRQAYYDNLCKTRAPRGRGKRARRQQQEEAAA